MNERNHFAPKASREENIFRKVEEFSLAAEKWIIVKSCPVHGGYKKCDRCCSDGAIYHAEQLYMLAARLARFFRHLCLCRWQWSFSTAWKFQCLWNRSLVKAKGRSETRNQIYTSPRYESFNEDHADGMRHFPLQFCLTSLMNNVEGRWLCNTNISPWNSVTFVWKFPL